MCDVDFLVRQLPNLIITLGASFFGILLVYCFVRGLPADYTASIQILLLILVALALLCLKLPQHFKIRFSLTIITAGALILTVEIATNFMQEPNQGGGLSHDNLKVAKSRNIPFDERTLVDVIYDMRVSGIEVYPMAFRAVIGERTWNANGQDTFSLSGISQTLTVSCNESGRYIIYPSDEYGFNNPLGIWSLGSMDMVLLGDSFTYGQCVDPDKTYASLIRTVFPNSLNLGSPGSGPLDQLAIMKEYIYQVKPNAVLWFFSEGNDLFDLRLENRVSKTTSYLESDFHQGLISLQPEIDKHLKAEIDWRLARERQGKWGYRWWWERVKIRTLRNHLPNDRDGIPCHINDDVFSLYHRILQDGKDYVAQWGGELYLVYLPAWERYGHLKNQCPLPMSIDLRVATIAKDLGLKFIDVKESFNQHKDPLSLFPFRLYGHYNELGYELVADTVIQSLDSFDIKTFGN